MTVINQQNYTVHYAWYEMAALKPVKLVEVTTVHTS